MAGNVELANRALDAAPRSQECKIHISSVVRADTRSSRPPAALNDELV